MINVKSESVTLTIHTLITEIRIVLQTIFNGGTFVQFVFSGTYVLPCTDYSYEHATEVTA